MSEIEELRARLAAAEADADRLADALRRRFSWWSGGGDCYVDSRADGDVERRTNRTVENALRLHDKAVALREVRP